jgi:glycosyltransferase involved in cell wall biosynthesis
MKRTMHVVKAFERAQQDQPDLQLDIIGDYSSSYGKKVYKHAQKSAAKKAITFHGHVTNDERSELLKNASAIIITSVKEGWGLIATEAAARSVPAIAYDTDGLRDSVIEKKTGTLVPSGNIDKLSKAIKKCLKDSAKLEAMGRQALENSRQYTFENSYSDFSSHLGILLEKNRKKKHE